MSCHVDSQRKNILTKFTKDKKCESDHNSIFTRFRIEWNSDIKTEKIEIFNFKDPKGIKKFKELTLNSNVLSSIFDTNKDVNVQTKKLLKRLNGILHECFRKIKITGASKKQTEIHDLYKQQEYLKFKTNSESIKEQTKVEN